MIPVPGFAVGTPYGQRGPRWSCNKDARGNGIHTGVDYPAPKGTPVVAARGGKVVYCSHGAAFGSHQVEILPGDGTRDFYAHLSTRLVGNGATVKAGDRIGLVGDEGNVTGAHLHFERHSVAAGAWSCAVVRDPAPSVAYVSPAKKAAVKAAVNPWASGQVYVAKLKRGTTNSDSVSRLVYRLRHHTKIPAAYAPPKQTDNYGTNVVQAVAYYQNKVRPNLPGPKDGASLSNEQADQLFGNTYDVIGK